MQKTKRVPARKFLFSFSPRHTVTGCIVALSLLTAVPLRAANRLWSNTGTDYNAGTSWGGTAPGSGDNAYFDAAAVTQPNLTADITNQQVRFSAAAASGYTISANAGAELTLTSVGTGTTAGTGAALVGANTSGINTIAAPIILGAAGGSTQTFHVTPGSALLVSGDVSESNSGIKLRVESSSATSGILNLSGNNSFSGGLLLTSGILSVNALADSGASALGNSGTITLNGGTLTYTGGATSTSRAIDLTASSTLYSSGSGALKFLGSFTASGTGSTRVLNLGGGNTGDNEISGAIVNSSGGTTSVVAGHLGSPGTWILSGANAFTGGITVNNGILVLDYAVNATVVNSANNLTLGGGTLQLQGKSGTASAQTLGNLTLTTNTQSRIEPMANGVGGTMALTLGNTWTAGTTSALYLGLPAGTTLTSSPTLTNGLLKYAVVQDASGIGLATTVAGNVVRYSYGPSEQLTAFPPFSNVANLYHTGNLTMTGGTTIGYTLDIDTAGGGTLDLGGGTRSVNAAGSVLFHGAGGYTIANGTLAANSSSGDLIFHQYADGVVTLSSWGTANNSLSKSGPGTLVLSNKGGAGDLRIYEGAVRADNTSVLTNYWLGNGKTIILNGGVLELGAAGDCTNSIGTVSGNIRFLGNGGFSAYGAPRAVQLNNGTASIDWGSANFVPANSALILSGKDANALLDFQNGLGFGNQQRIVRVIDGAAAADARLSGVLSSNYGGGLIKDGAGALEITGNSNTYIGQTWVTTGTLLVNNTSGSGTGSGAVTVASGATLGGSGTISGAVTVDGSIAPGNSIGILTIGSDVTWNAGDAWRFELGAAGVSLASPGSSDLLDITGGTSDFLKGSGSGWTFDFAGTGADGWYKLVDWAGATTFVAGNFTAANLASGAIGSFTVDAGTSALYLQITTDIPEPATALLLAAAATLGLARRRRA